MANIAFCLLNLLVVVLLFSVLGGKIYFIIHCPSKTAKFLGSKSTYELIHSLYLHLAFKPMGNVYNTLCSNSLAKLTVL